MKRSLIAAALALATFGALAQGPGYGPGPGPGYGPGMMGGYGYGAGMMGGYGPGMMRGFGPGYGLPGVNLTSEQADKIAGIQEEARRKNWDTIGQLRAETFKLRRMAFAEKIDSAAYLEQQKKVDELRRQMLQSRLETRKQIEAVLTPEQRRQLRQFGPWWLEDDDSD